jgi:hypothetical protein
MANDRVLYLVKQRGCAAMFEAKIILRAKNNNGAGAARVPDCEMCGKVQKNLDI